MCCFLVSLWVAERLKLLRPIRCHGGSWLRGNCVAYAPPPRRQSTWGRIGTPGSSRRVCYCRGGILRVVRVLLAARPAGVIGSKPSLTGAPQSGWAAAGAPRICAGCVQGGSF